MRDEKKQKRQLEIETAAYRELEKKGYAGTSMQGIARVARASNETLYNWYGDKQGLFKALVARNAKEVKTLLASELSSQKDGLSILELLGPKLLMLLLGNRAIALNRAAAADPSGELGEALSLAGRESVLPLLQQVFEAAKVGGQLSFENSSETVGLYLNLLVGDLQIRRVIGRLDRPSQAFCDERGKQAIAYLLRLCS